MMIGSTTLLNRPGADIAEIDGVHAMTDVTGFGLLGHLAEICRGSGVAAVNLQIILLVTADVSCQSNCPQDRTENVPAVAGSGFVALSTRRRLSELYATPPSMLDIAYPRRTFSRALSGSNTSCTSCHENVYGDVDGDGDG